MAVLADNVVYLKIDNVEVQAYFKEVKPSLSNDGKDSTAGSGVDWSEMTPGLNKLSLAITIEYDVAQVAAQIQHIAAGQVVSIEYGPEGAVSGKPRHVGDFLISKLDHGRNVDKTPTAWDITAESAAEPSVNMYAGGVYS